MQPQRIYPLPHLDVVDATLLSIVLANIHLDDINDNKYLINTITLTSAATAATTAPIE
jgi:hypothetical protein